MSANQDIEQRILQCVDEALGTLGKSGKKTLLLHLEKHAGINRKEIPTKPELLSNELNLILGRLGAVPIKKLIVKKLLADFGLRQKPDLTLTETIKLIKAAQQKPRHVAASGL